MSVAALALPTDLAGLADAAARRTGSWVVVESGGLVLAHGSGTGPCPAAVAAAVLEKTTAALRDAVRWERGTRPLRGQVDGVNVTAVDLAPGATAWFAGAGVDDTLLPALAAAAVGDEPQADPGIADLLHPRGVRSGAAPTARLLVVRADLPAPAVYAHVRRLVAGTTARLHAEPGLVLVALEATADPAPLVGALVSALPGVAVGGAAVPSGAADWTAALQLAQSCADVATDLGLPYADPRSTRVAAELVVREAGQAAQELAGLLPVDPLAALRESDARSGTQHIATLTAWCRAGFDVPAAAVALHLHANTLRYRLRRLETTGGLDLACPRQLMALQLLLT